MKCEKCGVNDVNVHYKLQIDGETREMRLCASCAAKLGLDAPESFLMAWPLSGFFSNFAEPRVRANERGCPVCGQTIAKIRESGRLGCSQCYERFAAQLEPNLVKLYGNVGHRGKIPLSAGEDIRCKRLIEQLNAQMQEAVARQDYERAAELRDEIKRMGGERA